ncbi:MAG: tetratricopeptide repeat protein [Parvibaculum sp.]
MAFTKFTRIARVVFVSALISGLAGCAGLGGFGNGRKDAVFGDYLAARYASSVHDPKVAARYFDATLADDADNVMVLDQALSTATSAGEMDRAVSLSRRIVKLAPEHRMARLILSLNDMRKGDYAEARKEIGSAQAGVFMALVGSLTQSWASAGEGDKPGALASLKSFEDKPAFDLFRTYHTALILDLLGDAPEALKAYREAMDASGGASIRIVEGYASFLSRQGENDKALSAVKDFLTLSPRHPLALADLAALQTGKPVKPVVANAPEGIAEALYGLGSALAQESGSDLAIVYLRLAIWMRPDFDVANTLLADTYEQKKLWQNAVDAYGKVTRSSPLYSNAQIQSAIDLDRLERQPEAIAMLQALSKDEPDSIEPYVALGDIYRAKEKYAEAAAQYSHAIEMAGKPQPSHWTLYYALGICNERLGNWPVAESNLKRALELSGEHPLVLNYLGYSWIEQGTHLDEALAMIEKAVSLRPTDGFIVDSLGWAQYRLGDYAQAVHVLQRAVELEPGDSTINEHLGDAFWKVGRKIEARFQWSHALEMKPEPGHVENLKAKLLYGLDAATTRQSPKPAIGS